MRRLRIAVLVLAGLGSPTSFARSDPPPTARAAIIERLERALGDADRGVRYAAVQALGKAKAPPAKFARGLDDPERCVRQEAGWWLRRGGTDALLVIEGTFLKGSPRARSSATWALSSLGASALPLLADALRDADESVRLEALAAAARMEPLVAASLVPVIRPLAEANRSSAEREAATAALAVLVVVVTEPEEAPPPPMPGLAPSTPAPSETDLEKESATDPAFATSDQPDPLLDRIDAVLAMANGPADADPLVQATRDPERDVRLAAVIALDRAKGSASAPLLAALRDPNARVVRLAIGALGRRRVAATEIAPFLADPTLATSCAAREALEKIGAEAVLPVVEQMARGGYGALHHGRLFFEAVGAAGAPATATLATMLRHDDVNVRTTAARCLSSIGRGAHDAAPELAKALHDPRLCVVANAAVALGRVGPSEQATAAMDDPSARVRAYATLAVGWALGDDTGVDQVVYEPRLPVLDLGSPGPFPPVDALDGIDPDERAAQDVIDRVLRPAIYSKDPAIAARAAGLIRAGDVDEIDIERVMELTLPEAVRPEFWVTTDRQERVVAGSEWAAFLEYFTRANRTSRELESVLYALRNVVRSDDIPALLWIVRNQEPILRGGFVDQWGSAARSTRFRRDLAIHGLSRDPGADAADVARAWLEAYRTGVEGGMIRPAVWLLRDFVPRSDESALLLDCARRAESPGPSDCVYHVPTHEALVRLLGFLTDEPSMTYLRERAAAGDEASRDVAWAALARRGDAKALASLVRRSREKATAFTLLMDVAPRIATRAWLARVLKDPSSYETREAAAQLVENACEFGVTVPPEALLGVEATLARRLEDIGALSLVARKVPLCRTRRMADRLIERFTTHMTSNSSAWLGSGYPQNEAEEFRETVLFLETCDPDRTLPLVRALSKAHDPELVNAASAYLLRIHDVSSVGSLVAWLRTRARPAIDPELLVTFRQPEIRALLVDWSNDPARVEDEILGLLSRFDGWPEDRPVDLRKGDAVAKRAAIRVGDFTGLRALCAADAVEPPPEPEPSSRSIRFRAIQGDANARADVWSAILAGRWLGRFGPNVLELLTLGSDPATLPFWSSDLERDAYSQAGELFEALFGVPSVDGRHEDGVGRPPSEFVRDWMGFHASRFVWSPLLGRFVPEPE